MRLYSKTGAAQIDDPDHGTFRPDANGAFDGLPDAMYAKLHGRPGWENDPEREMRMAAEELDRYRDPATLLAEVKKLNTHQRADTAALVAAFAAALGGGQAEPAAAVPPPVVPAPVAKVAEPAEPTPNAKAESAETASAPAKLAETPAESASTAAKTPAVKESAKGSAKSGGKNSDKDSVDESDPEESAESEPKSARARKSTAASSK